MDDQQYDDDDAVDLDELDWFDELLIECKARGLSDAATALQLGCATKTIQRHRNRPAVRAALAARRADCVGQVTALLGELSSDAVGVLRDGLRAERFADRLRAAELALNLLLRYRTGPEIDQEVAVLREERAELQLPTEEDGR